MVKGNGKAWVALEGVKDLAAAEAKAWEVADGKVLVEEALAVTGRGCQAMVEDGKAGVGADLVAVDGEARLKSLGAVEADGKARVEDLVVVVEAEKSGVVLNGKAGVVDLVEVAKAGVVEDGKARVED